MKLDWTKEYHILSRVTAYHAEMTIPYRAYVIVDHDKGRIDWRLQKDTTKHIFSSGTAKTVEEAKLECEKAWSRPKTTDTENQR